MTTATEAPPRVFRWWLEIVDTVELKKGPREERTLYRVDRLGPCAFRLTKSPKDNYVVSLREYGWRCDCPDWKTRRERKGLPCKHHLGLVQLGLIPGVDFQRQTEAYRVGG